MIKASHKNKEFRDPVHGYITVPADWCEAFIDTAIFQRLRHVEQTMMGFLYPSARHDRFTHSLGVYHLAKIAFECLQVNTNPDILDGIDLNQYKAAFLAAALMHDCAHASFSHTFEYLYDKRRRQSDQYPKAEKFLFENANSAFIKDFPSPGPAPHENFSAAIFLKDFRKHFARLAPGSDPVLVARMITGCIHKKCPTVRTQVENCLIRLINGSTVDVDKLDYILRDTWASGVDNVSIDVLRLLSALEIVATPSGFLDVAFRKSALNVVQSVIDGRNYLYRWIYSHHTVCYYSGVLRSAVEELNKAISPKTNPEAFLDAISCEKVFECPVPVGSKVFYLPCDDDIFSLLKTSRNRKTRLGKLADELISRKPSRIPLWKTAPEFEILFSNRNAKERSAIRKDVKNLLKDVLGAKAANEVMVEDAKSKMLDLMNFDESRLWIKFGALLDNRVMSFQDIAKTWQEEVPKKNPTAFYVFIPREAKAKVSKCIKKLTQAPVSG